jgi:hypothetical protein
LAAAFGPQLPCRRRQRKLKLNLFLKPGDERIYRITRAGAA